MKLGNSNPVIVDFDPYATNTVQNHGMGEYANIGDGRSFRFAQAGAVALAKGKLGQAPAPKTNHHNVAVASAAAVGASTVTVTLGATAAVAQEYVEGYLAINDNAGEGQTYKISDQPAAASSAALTVTLFDNVSVALTTSSEATLVHHAQKGVVEVASATRRPSGVPLVDVAISGYYWGQVKGVSSVLADQAIALGSRCVASGSVAGAVVAESTTAATAVVTTQVALANILAGVDTEYRPLFLTFD